MDRLSGLDASFLYLETPAQLMHVCGLIVLDPSTMPEGYSFASLRPGSTGRSATCRPSPASCAGAAGLGPPDLGARQALRHRAARAPAGAPGAGGYDELVELASHLAGLPLDRSRPLWEMWVIEGYLGGDQVVVFSKMHHATVDGVSGSNLISHLCALEADAEPLALGPQQRHPARGRCR